MNKTRIDNNRLFVELDRCRPKGEEDFAALAARVAKHLYGEGHVPTNIPFHKDEGYACWGLDLDNDWFLHVRVKGQTTTLEVWHRDPQPKHMLIIGGLEFALGRMMLLLPSDLIDNGPEKHIGSDTPMYQHSCEKCEFLGKWKGDDDGHETVFDLYYCNPSGTPTILARYSDGEGSYISGMTFGKKRIVPAMTEAYRRAVKAGLIDDQAWL